MSTFPGQYIEDVPDKVRTIVGVNTSVTAFVGYTAHGPTNKPIRIFSFGEFERQFGGLAVLSHVGYAVHQFFQNGGREAWVVRVTKDANGGPPDEEELTGRRSKKTGLYALENVDLFGMLCIPNASLKAVLGEALAYCEERRAFLLIDLPEDDKFVTARSWLAKNASLRLPNAAAYFPRIKLPDPLQGSRVRAFPACGAVAGLWARTDRERGVWKAPSGTDAVLTGVRGLTYTLTTHEARELNRLGLNCIRNLPVYGNVSWGARTLAGADNMASEWKYIPVRRLALFIEESLYRGTQWVVFEPNDEPLWAQIRLNVGAFMHNLYRQGAFQGSSPRDAYFIKCDEETTTQDDTDRGIVNFLVGFAPLKPGEFIIVKISQTGWRKAQT